MKKPKDLFLASRSRLAVLGAGTYWGMQLISTVHPQGISFSSIALDDVVLYGAEIAFECLIVLAAIMCGRRLAGNVVQRVLAWGVAGGFTVDLLLEATTLANTAAGASVALFALTLGRISTLLLWGLCFTSLEKQDAERTALAALVLALGLYLVLLLVPFDGFPTEQLTYALAVATVVPILANRQRFATERRDGPPNKEVLVPFYASRLFFGACHGAITFIPLGAVVVLGERSWPLTLAALAAMIVFFLSQKERLASSLAMLRLAPVFACGIIACPFIGANDLDTVVLSCASIFPWMAWSILHSVQLSAMKHSSGLDDCTLAFSEKAAFIAASILVKSILSAIPGLTTALAAHPQVQTALVAVIAFSAVLVSCYLLSQVIDGKETERIVNGTRALHERGLEPVFDQMAADHGLTAREKEVLHLLAKNRTRPTICEELCISEGTYRTHIYRIYKKLGVHSHDELLELVERSAQEYVAR